MRGNLLERGIPIGPQVVNVASVPQRSPFRYPGGKTWLVPRIREWLCSFERKPRLFIEPFAGGGIVSLTVAMEGLADRVLMAELDTAVASVWKVIINGDYKELIRRILGFRMNRERVVEELRKDPKKEIDKAFQTILRNRVQRGGILAPGASLVKNGENGKGVASRWYPETLARRIEAIAAVRDKIEFRHSDAIEVMPYYLGWRSSAFFIDPPYTAGGKSAGKRLYAHSQLDHYALFSLMSRARGSVMMTYDDALEVRALARDFGFRIEEIAMANTHHNLLFELVITNRISPEASSLVRRRKRRPLLSTTVGNN